MTPKPRTRDFNTRPRQAVGRTQSNYGRTALGRSTREPQGGFVWTVAATTAIVLFGLWLGGYAGGVV